MIVHLLLKPTQMNIIVAILFTNEHNCLSAAFFTVNDVYWFVLLVLRVELASEHLLNKEYHVAMNRIGKKKLKLSEGYIFGYKILNDLSLFKITALTIGNKLSDIGWLESERRRRFSVVDDRCLIIMEH